MPNAVFGGISDAVFGALKETVQATLTMIPAPISPPFTQTVDCIFFDKDTDVTLPGRSVYGGKGVEMRAIRPTAVIKIADVNPQPKFGDHLFVVGNNYKVLEVFFDGLSANQLVLAKL